MLTSDYFEVCFFFYAYLCSLFSPKIMVENGTKNEDGKKVPVSEVKPIKKDKRSLESSSKKKSEKRDTLDVQQTRPKCKVKEDKNSNGKHKEEAKYKHRSKESGSESGIRKKVAILKENASKIEETELKLIELKGKIKTETLTSKEDGEKTKLSEEEVQKSTFTEKEESIQLEKTKEANIKEANEEKNEMRQEETKGNVQKSPKSTKEKKKSFFASKSKKGSKIQKEEKEAKNGNVCAMGECSQMDEKCFSRQNTSDSLKTGSGSAAKPPSVLVYADSLVTKENVKSVLNSILNKEK